MFCRTISFNMTVIFVTNIIVYYLTYIVEKVVIIALAVFLVIVCVIVFKISHTRRSKVLVTSHNIQDTTRIVAIFLVTFIPRPTVRDAFF